MSTMSQAVAQVVRSELGARQIEPSDFATDARMSKTTAWRKVRGLSKITIDDTQAFAVALGWSLDELAGRAKALLDAGAVHPVPVDDAEGAAGAAMAGLSPDAASAVRDAAKRVRRPLRDDNEEGTSEVG